jgi:hypothetical protein
MNNSKIALENIESEGFIEKIPYLRTRESELIKIVEAISHINQSEDWNILKSYVFDGVLESLERRLSAEAKKDNPDTQELARLVGQITWAKKYSKLEELQEMFRSELTNLRKQINAKV